MRTGRYLDENISKELAKDVTAWIKKKGFTQVDVGRLSGKSHATLTRALVHYQITPNTASALCKLTGKSLSDYLNNDYVLPEAYDFDFLRQCLCDYLKTKGIKSTTFAIINGIDKETISKFVDGDITFVDKADMAKICNGMHKSEKCFLVNKKEQKKPDDEQKKVEEPLQTQSEVKIDLEDLKNQILVILSDTLSETFSDFLESHADDLIPKKKKGWFR